MFDYIPLGIARSLSCKLPSRGLFCLIISYIEWEQQGKLEFILSEALIVITPNNMQAKLILLNVFLVLFDNRNKHEEHSSFLIIGQTYDRSVD